MFRHLINLFKNPYKTKCPRNRAIIAKSPLKNIDWYRERICVLCFIYEWYTHEPMHKKSVVRSENRSANVNLRN